MEQLAVNAAEARFTSLYDTHYRAILGYLVRRVHSMATAQDLAEDVFLIAWTKLPDVPTGDEGGYWLYGVAKRVLANHQRKMARRSGITARFRLPSIDSDQPEQQLIRSTEAEAVDDAIAGLRDQDQELIRLAYWDELPHATIGALLGCSRSAVDVRLHRAVRRLRKAMARSGHIKVEEFELRAQEETPC